MVSEKNVSVLHNVFVRNLAKTLCDPDMVTLEGIRDNYFYKPKSKKSAEHGLTLIKMGSLKNYLGDFNTF